MPLISRVLPSEKSFQSKYFRSRGSVLCREACMHARNEDMIFTHCVNRRNMERIYLS